MGMKQNKDKRKQEEKDETFKMREIWRGKYGE